MSYCAMQKTDNKAEIYIFGDITTCPWPILGEVSAKTVADGIQNLDVTEINVHINSYGGAVSEGWGIYNVLLEHKATVTTYADGFVASAALYPFLAGDRRIAGSVSAFFLHQVMTGADGYAADLRKAAEMADTMTEIGVSAFVERAGMRRETVLQFMEQETWLTPEQALQYGIATAIVRSGAQDAASQSIKKRVLAAAMQMGKAPAPQNKETPRQSIMDTVAGMQFHFLRGD